MPDSTQKQGREVWLPVVSYGGRFRGSHQVSTHLRVRSVDRWSRDKNGKPFFTYGRMLNVRKGGYVTISNGVSIQASVTLLLREAIADGQGRKVPTSSPEEWREVPGYGGRYKVSNHRRVKDGDQIVPAYGGRIRLGGKDSDDVRTVRDLIVLTFGETVAWDTDR